MLAVMNHSEGDKPIEFQAINSGLGFHPFSDGLPYAPVSKATKTQPRPTLPPFSREPVSREPKKDLSTGAGAVAAGHPSMVLPKRPVSVEPRVSVPVAAPKAVPKTAPIPPVFSEVRYGFFYSFKRVLAYALDSVLNISLLVTGLSFGLLNQDISPDMLLNPGVILASFFFVGLFNWAIMSAQEVAFGTSVGKRVFGLALQGKTSTIFLRALLFLPSTAFCGAGLLWALFDSRRRCWHDVVVDLQPIEVARL